MYKIVCLLFIAFTIQNCGSDILEPSCDGSVATYDTNISSIINDSCNSAACHGSGSSKGDWTSYDNLKAVLDNGDFEQYVLIDQTMPKGIGSLSQDEINLIQCWMEQGYPEN